MRGVSKRSLVERVQDPRPYRNLIDLTGKRFGSLTVLRLGQTHRSPSGQVHRCWWVRCDCGKQYTVAGASLRGCRGVPGVKSCRDCGKARSLAANHARSTRLPSGRTLVETAQASGVSLNTVTQRWLRGWDEADLGLPVVGNAGRKQRATEAA